MIGQPGAAAHEREKIEMTGTIGVYSEKRTGNVTENWKPKHHEHSGRLPSNTEEPLWWGNPGSNGEKFAVNKIVVSWGGYNAHSETNLVSLTQTRKYE